MIPLSLALLLLASGSPEPAPTPEPACGFVDCLVLTLGVGIASDAYPLSSAKNADGKPQHSFLGGARFWIGTRWPHRLALRGVFDFGYVTVGAIPKRGSDGLMESAGLEVSLDTFDLVKPFVRFRYEAVVQRIAAIVSGTDDKILKANALALHAGVFIGFVDLHLAVARDFAGGVSPGIGFSVAWIN